MPISFYTIVMTVIWSSVLIILFYVLRKKLMVLEVCSVSGTVSVYLFCLVRLLVPLEFPWTKTIDGGTFWKGLHYLFKTELFQIGTTPITTGNLFLTIWIAVALIIITKIIIDYTKLQHYVACLSKGAMENWLPTVDGISIYKSGQIHHPCAAGIIHRTVLFPDREYTKKQEAYILMHEISHHKNGDILIKLLVNIICAIYWWNPFIYLLRKDINQSLEIRCDKRVTQFLEKEKKAEYLSVILEEFEHTVENSDAEKEYVMELLGSEEDALVERFQLVAKGNYSVSWWKRMVLVIVLTFVLASSYAFVLQPEFEAPEEDLGDKGYYFDETNSYVFKSKNRRYYLVTPYNLTEIDDETASFYLDNGFMLKEE